MFGLSGLSVFVNDSKFDRTPRLLTLPPAASPAPDALSGLQQLSEAVLLAGLLFGALRAGGREMQGAAGIYDIKPDLVTYGKVIGGGLPVGAFGGRGDVMDKLAPLGPVYQAGTLSGNPVAMTAGAAPWSSSARTASARSARALPTCLAWPTG